MASLLTNKSPSILNSGHLLAKLRRHCTGGASSSTDPAPPLDKPPREPKKKTVSQEAWNLLKSATVKITEADGLRNKLVLSGMFLVFG